MTDKADELTVGEVVEHLARIKVMTYQGWTWRYKGSVDIDPETGVWAVRDWED